MAFAALLPFLPMLLAGAAGAASKATEKKPSLSKFDVFSPEQKDFQSQLLNVLRQQLGSGGLYGQGQNYLQELLGGSPEAYQRFEAPYKRQFQEEIVPELAERFSGIGAGAQSSSAFQQSLGQAGAGLSERLAMLREGLRGGAATSALNAPSQFLSSAFQSPFGYQQNPGGGRLSSALGAFGAGIAPGAGELGGSLLTDYLKRPQSFQTGRGVVTTNMRR